MIRLDIKNSWGWKNKQMPVFQVRNEKLKRSRKIKEIRYQKVIGLEKKQILVFIKRVY